MSRINSRSAERIQISQGNRQASKRKVFIVIILILLIIIALLIYAFLGAKNEVESFNQVVTPENVEEILAQIQDSDKTPPNNYEVYMNTTWTFPDANSPSKDAIVGNQKNNINTVFFTVALKDTSQQVYKSPYIPVGSNLENIVLDEKLRAGTYPAVITYHLVDDNFKELSSVSVNMTLVIQS